MEIKYGIKFTCGQIEPYWYDDSKEPVDYTTTEEYRGLSLERLKRILKDIIDSPNEPLTDEGIQNDFGDKKRPIKAENVQTIKDYYNFRYYLHKKVLADLEPLENHPKDQAICTSFHYDIPEDKNKFVVYDGDDDDEKVSHQTICSIEIVAQNIV